MTETFQEKMAAMAGLSREEMAKRMSLPIMPHHGNDVPQVEVLLHQRQRQGAGGNRLDRWRVRGMVTG